MNNIPPQQPLLGAHLLLIQDGKILLEKRKGGYYDGKYDLVCGHTEKGETIIEAIVREAKEESNISLNPNNLEVKVIVHEIDTPYKGKLADIIKILVFTDSYEGQINNNEPDRCSELNFYPLDNLPAETIPYIKEAIEAFQTGKIYIVNRD